MQMQMHEGLLTVNLESGMYEVFLTEYSERMPLCNGDEFLVMVEGDWKNTKIVFSETEDDWILEGIDIKAWGVGSMVKVELFSEEDEEEWQLE